MGMLCERKMLKLKMSKDKDLINFFSRFDNCLAKLIACSDEDVRETRRLNYFMLVLPDE